MIEQIIVYVVMFLGLFLAYLSIRNTWVCRWRCEHIEKDIEEFKEVDKKFSYGSMLVKYFWVWDYNWFKERK